MGVTTIGDFSRFFLTASLREAIIRKIYFAKKFHKTVTPHRGFMKVLSMFFEGSNILEEEMGNLWKAGSSTAFVEQQFDSLCFMPCSQSMLHSFIIHASRGSTTIYIGCNVQDAQKTL